MKRLIRCFWFTLALATMLMAGCQKGYDSEEALEIASLHYQSGKYPEAIAVLSEVLGTTPDDPKALLLRSQCYYELMERRSQASDLTRLLEIDTIACQKKIIYANDIANAYDYLFIDDSTIKYQLLILALKKQCEFKEFSEANVYEILANLYCRKGQYETALALIDSSESFGNDRYSIASSRFNVYKKTEERDSALIWISEAIATQEAFPGTITEPGWDYQNRADLYHQKGDLKSACADWQKALDLGLKEAQPKLDSFCAGRR